ncbi:CvpA family protein [Campylobacter jejuni]|nr:CvpA family protein [Campylobacter jejuni]
MNNFYWFDIFIFGLTLLLGFKGIVNGLVKEVFGLAGIIGGVLIASRFAQEVGNLIQTYIYNINNEDLSAFAGFLCVLFVFWVFCLICGNLLSKLIKMSGLGFVDRLGGFIFGSFKVFLIFAILIFCIGRVGFLNTYLEKYAQGSYSLPLLKNMGAFIMNSSITQENIPMLEESTDLESTQIQGDI